MSSRQQLHDLVEQLYETEVRAAHRVLQALCLDAVQLSLFTSPYDDEPETEEERTAVQQTREELARGEGIPFEDVQREFDR